MQPQAPKSIGGALVDVFDAALTLVKTEIRLVARRVGNIVKAKGMGALLLLAAAAPLSLALIFLILTLFYGLIALGVPTWGSAFIIAILALVVTGVLVMLGVRKLTAEVPEDKTTEADLAREDVKSAEKKLEKAEKATEKDEKRVEKAERDLERARQHAVGSQGGSPATSGTHGNVPNPASGGARPASSSGTGSVHSTTPATGGTAHARDGHGAASAVHGAQSHRDNANATRRVSEEDGIPVSTQPQLEELDKGDRK